MSAKLEINTVIGCRINCAYCPQTLFTTSYRQRGRQIRVLSLNDFKQCLSTVPLNVRITFAGMAEPWLNPACTDMVLHAFERGYPVAVYSTLCGMTVSDVERIRHIPFLRFKVHLPDQENRMHLTIDETYLATLKAVIELPIFSFVCYGTIDPKVREIIGPVTDSTDTDLQSRAGNISWDGRIPQVTRHKGRIDVRHCIDHNVLLPNGDVALCCQDYGLKHILGNLLAQTYQSLFEGAEFKKLKLAANDETVDTLCRTCYNAIPVSASAEQTLIA